jgi:hypothetical protein
MRRPHAPRKTEQPQQCFLQDDQPGERADESQHMTALVEENHEQAKGTGVDSAAKDKARDPLPKGRGRDGQIWQAVRAHFALRSTTKAGANRQKRKPRATVYFIRSAEAMIA